MPTAPPVHGPVCKVSRATLLVSCFVSLVLCLVSLHCVLTSVRIFVDKPYTKVMMRKLPRQVYSYRPSVTRLLPDCTGTHGFSENQRGRSCSTRHCFLEPRHVPYVFFRRERSSCSGFNAHSKHNLTIQTTSLRSAFVQNKVSMFYFFGGGGYRPLAGQRKG